LDKCKIVGREFVVASCHAPTVFDLVEEPLDQISCPVKIRAEAQYLCAFFWCLTNQQLAEHVGMSSSAYWRRVKHLEEAGIIRGYAALVDRRKAGFTVSAIVHVLLARHETMDVEPFEERILRQPEVLECVATSGEADYHLRVVARDIEVYYQFLNNVMFKMQGVAHVRSYIVLKEIKTEVALPLGR
jgi:Lrp/AsnC family transcriptional regulator, leucine-responsive regulatory protein